MIHHGAHRWSAMLAGLCLALGAVSPALAQDAGTTVELTARAPWGQSGLTARVTAGVSPAATDAYDAGLDVPALLAGPLQVWFHQGGQAIADLKKDIRGAAGEWELHVGTPATGLGVPVREGSTVTLSWEPPVNAAGMCSGRAFTLIDAVADVSVDMTAANTYSFGAPAAGASRVLTLAIGAAAGGGAGVPDAPGQPRAPRISRRGVLLVWPPSTGPGVAGYHVERSDNPDAATPAFRRLTTHPVTETRWLDAGVVGGQAVSYRIVAVSGAGCESAPSPILPIAP